MFALHLVGYYRGGNKNTDTCLAESLHQRAIVKLTHDTRADLMHIEPPHQRQSNSGFLAGNKQGGSIKNTRPGLRERCRKAWLGKKCNTAVSKFMAVAFYVCFRGHGPVSEDQVETLDRQFHQQAHE